MRPLSPARWAPSPPLLGSANTVLRARSRRHSVASFCGPLSIKTVLKGRVTWFLDRRELWVDHTSFLVLNDGEPYSMEIDEQEPVETLVIFFQRGFVESVLHELSRSIERTLDDPAMSSAEALFLNRLRPRSPRLAASISQLSTLVDVAAPCSMARDEHYLHLAAELLRESEETRKLMRSVPAGRRSTRAELLRRVAIGRDRIHAAPDESMTLAEVARAAGMSPFHFQRTFTAVFGTSPARYAANLRMQSAAERLRAGVDVTQVALEAGYAGIASFSTAFRRWAGVAPSAFACKFRKISKAHPV